MNNASAPRQRIVVLGGGITGLAAAHRLVELDPTREVLLLEAADHLGGVLQTFRRDGFLLERSADNFITNVPWATELCRRIGFADQLIPTAEGQRSAMVVHRGQLVPVPAGFMLMAPDRIGPILTTPLLSPLGKLRLVGELLVPKRREEGDESLAAFVRRRLGRETFERIVQPLVGGIYTADPEKLSLQATLPRFIDMEQRHGSLIRATWKARGNQSETGRADSGARYGLFVAPREGMSSLVDAVARRLPQGCVRLGHRVRHLAVDSTGRWTIHASTPDGALELTADGVIVALRASVAARVVEPLDAHLAGLLGRVEFAGTSIVSLAFRREQVGRGLDCFGFVVPAIEKRKILAASFSSVKFPGRAPDGTVLVRVFVGGACQADLADLDDAQLRALATSELAELAGVRGEPLFCEITRWPASMPQYHVGHCQLVSQIETAAERWPTLALAGNAYHGVGVPNCIHSGERAAQQLLERLATQAASV